MGNIVRFEQSRYIDQNLNVPDSVHRHATAPRLPEQLHVHQILTCQEGLLSSQIQKIYLALRKSDGPFYLAFHQATPLTYGALALGALIAKVADVAIGILSLPLSLIYEPIRTVLESTSIEIRAKDQTGSCTKFTEQQLHLFNLAAFVRSFQQGVFDVYGAIERLEARLLLSASVCTVHALCMPIQGILQIAEAAVLRLSGSAPISARIASDQLGIGLIDRCLSHAFGHTGELGTQTHLYPIFTCLTNPAAPERLFMSTEQEAATGASTNTVSGGPGNGLLYQKDPARTLTFQRHLWS